MPHPSRFRVRRLSQDVLAAMTPDQRKEARAIQNRQLEDQFAFYCRAAKLPAPVPQYPFSYPAKRKRKDTSDRRLDFAWPDVRVCLEIQGGVYVAGRHSRGPQMRSDFEKFNELQIAGWTVILAESDAVTSGRVVALVERAIRFRRGMQAAEVSAL